MLAWLLRSGLGLLVSANGSKTYIGSAMLLLLAALDLSGLVPQEVKDAAYAAVTAAIVAALRHAIGKTPPPTVPIDPAPGPDLDQRLKPIEDRLSRVTAWFDGLWDTLPKRGVGLLLMAGLAACAAGCGATAPGSADALGQQLSSYPGTWDIEVNILDGRGQARASKTVALQDDTLLPRPPDFPLPMPQPQPAPLPAPQPAPQPTPQPVDRFAIEAKLTAAARSVNVANRSSECDRLSGRASAIASQIDTGQLTSAQSVITALVAELSPLPAPWAPVKTAAKTEIQRLYTAGMLDTMPAWSEFCQSCARALTAAR